MEMNRSSSWKEGAIEKRIFTEVAMQQKESYLEHLIQEEKKKKKKKSSNVTEGTDNVLDFIDRKSKWLGLYGANK